MPDRERTVTIHRAAWLVPIDRPPVPNGALASDGRVILAAGGYSEVQALAPRHAKVTDHGDVALLPGMINAHTHLELTPLEGRIPLPQEGFPSWVQEVFRLRPSLDAASPRVGVADGLGRLAVAGTCLCGDISNDPTTLLQATIDSDGAAPKGWPIRYPFLELVGFDCASLEAALERASAGPLPHSGLRLGNAGLAAHAVYSTSAAVIQQAKEWCRSRGRVFGMHVAEHPQELEFLKTGNGFCRKLLDRLGRWVDGWQPPGSTPVAYLDALGVLDASTLLVHAVHLSASDWDTVASRGCAVCLCPRSNRSLQSGKADPGAAMRRGVPLALGTDSLASNVDLNLFAEAAFCLDQHPELSADAVLTMMTLGGARALGCLNRFGSLTAGKVARVIAVPADAGLPAAQLSETILHTGKEGAVAWALGPEIA